MDLLKKKSMSKNKTVWETALPLPPLSRRKVRDIYEAGKAILRHFFVFLVVTACFLGSTAAAENFPAGYVITIENVQLKDSSGNWLSIIRPDKQVDLTKTEAAVSFFNNTGRVPPDSYDNFRVDFLRPDGQKVRLSSSIALERPLWVKKGSFIRVWFELEAKTGQELQAKKASVTVDGQTEEMEKLQWS